MIFHITRDFADSLKGEDLSELASEILANGHRLTSDCSKTMDLIKNSVVTHGSTKQKTLMKGYGWPRPTKLETACLIKRVPEKDYDVEYLIHLAKNPGYVFLENERNEWPTYKRIAECYKGDRAYGSLFVALKTASDEGRIQAIQCGGWSELMPLHKSKGIDSKLNECDWHYKTLLLFDRDTADAQSLDKDKKKLFEYVAERSTESPTEADIRLMYESAQNRMGWHMWYKRSIENYFDDECFTKSSMGAVQTNGNQRDYVKIDSSTSTGYDKSRLPELASKASRERMETGLERFYCPNIGKQVSEMQLFLLKLVKLM